VLVSSEWVNVIVPLIVQAAVPVAPAV
jgi:hypothetical protein